jgi:hypothetical protein
MLDFLVSVYVQCNLLANPCPKTLIMHQPLNASKVFSSMTVFDLLRLVPVYQMLTAVQGQYWHGMILLTCNLPWGPNKRSLDHIHCILTGSGPTLAELWQARQIHLGSARPPDRPRADLAKARLKGSRLGSRDRQNAVIPAVE